MKASGVLEQIDFVELATASEFFESDPPVADALSTSAEEGAAWTLMYPHYTVVRPYGVDARTPLYYFVAEPSQLRDFIQSWLRLKRRDGTIQQLYDYWILGKDERHRPPRWCIMRNVLHWSG